MFWKTAGRKTFGRYQWREAYACCVCDSNIGAIKTIVE
jgi:hypothetical protein